MSRHPLALGLIRHAPDTTTATRRQARVALTGRAGADGYAVVEIFEVDGRPVTDHANLAALERTAQRLGSSVLLVHGDVDRRRVHALAHRTAMDVVDVDPAEVR